MVALLTIVFSLVIIAYSMTLGWWDPQRRGSHWLATLWGAAVFWWNPWWRIVVRGRAHLKPQRPYIFVANHQSQLDIMAVFAIRHQFKWVAKEELFRIPFLGWAMSTAKYIKLARGRHGSIRDTYEEAARWLSAGISVCFFPEGTRTQTGTLLPFKNGAFKLALDANIPVVPIAIHGTRELLPRGSWLLRRRSRVVLTILNPMDPAPYRTSGPGRFRDDARQLIHDTLQKLSQAQTPPSSAPSESSAS